MLYEELPIAYKAAIIRTCVRNGITRPKDIRTAYNNHVEGRNIFDGLSDSYSMASGFDNFLANGGRIVHKYGGETEPTQQMQQGVKGGIPVVYPQGSVYSYLDSHPNESVVMDEQEVIGHAPNARQRLAKYLSEAPARDIDRVMARYLATGIAPVAAEAAAPTFFAASDVIGATRAGQAATRLLTNPLVDATATSYFGAHGINDVAKGEATPMTALELMPLGRLVKPVGEAGMTIATDGYQFVNNLLDIRALKAFNNKYGYTAVKPKYSLAFDNQRLDDVFDNAVKRHNTFVRGVDPYETQQRFGRLTDLSPEEAAKYSLTHIPKVYKGNNAGLLEGENGLYLSNDFGTASGYTNNGAGYVGIVRRPIKYGQATRRDFLKENDFIFSRPPGLQRQYYTTKDEPNNPWIYRKMKGRGAYKYKRDTPRVDWSKHQDYEVRANAGAKIMEPSVAPNYRHYIMVGDVGDEPVELIDFFKPFTIGSKAHRGTSSVSLSRKKSYGGHLTL